jgi:hypothetical protein
VLVTSKGSVTGGDDYNHDDDELEQGHPDYLNFDQEDDPMIRFTPDTNAPKTVGKMSKMSAYITLVKGNVGPGCLVLPCAFAKAGIGASTLVRCAFSTEIYTRGCHWVPTPARLKLLHACDQCHSSRVITFLTK